MGTVRSRLVSYGPRATNVRIGSKVTADRLGMRWQRSFCGVEFWGHYAGKSGEWGDKGEKRA